MDNWHTLSVTYCSTKTRKREEQERKPWRKLSQSGGRGTSGCERQVWEEATTTHGIWTVLRLQTKVSDTFFSFHFFTHFFFCMYTVIMVYPKLFTPLNCTLILVFTADILCTRSGSPHNVLHSLALYRHALAFSVHCVNFSMHSPCIVLTLDPALLSLSCSEQWKFFHCSTCCASSIPKNLYSTCIFLKQNSAWSHMIQC